jgi:hypothetical protein
VANVSRQEQLSACDEGYQPRRIARTVSAFIHPIQLELDRHLNGKLARLLAAQDAVRIDGGAPIIIDDGLCIPTDLRRLSAVVLA